MNGDETVTSCELFDCIVMIENEWRDENAPNYGHVYCDALDYGYECDCLGGSEWSCADIA